MDEKRALTQPATVAPSDLVEVAVDEDGNVVGGVTRSSLRAEAAQYEQEGLHALAAPIRVALARSPRDPAALERLIDDVGGWGGDRRLNHPDFELSAQTVWVAAGPRPARCSWTRPANRRPGRARHARARRSSSRRGPPGRRSSGDDDPSEPSDVGRRRAR